MPNFSKGPKLSLIQGRIVRLKVARPDPQGKNPKPGRMYIVANTDASIKRGDNLTLVGISSTFKGIDSEVQLDWSNPGTHCSTGLIKPSAAICTWVESARQSEVDITSGFVQPRFLRPILLYLAPGTPVSQPVALPKPGK